MYIYYASVVTLKGQYFLRCTLFHLQTVEQKQQRIMKCSKYFFFFSKDVFVTKSEALLTQVFFCKTYSTVLSEDFNIYSLARW